MSTQNERELFEDYIADWARGFRDGKYINVAVQGAWVAWQTYRAPLLSRIAELEKQLADEEQQSATAWQQVAVQRSGFESRIDALSKDAERIRATWNHVKQSAKETDHGIYGPYHTIYSNDFNAIDAAISAREGE